LKTLRGRGLIVFCLLALVVLAGSGGAARGLGPGSTRPPLPAVAKGDFHGFAVRAATSDARIQAAVPDAPVLAAPVPGDRSVRLEWSVPNDNGSPITGFDVYRGSTSGDETLLTTLGPQTSYTDTGLTNGAIYFYEVSAINGAGEGARSGEVSATPSTAPGAPTLGLANPGNGSISLAWGAPSSTGGSMITGYRVYRGPPGQPKTLLATLGVMFLYTDANVTIGVQYAYDVTAVNVMGEGPHSNELVASPIGPPSAPALDPAVGGDGSVGLSWTTPASNGSPIAGYNVYRGTSSGGETFLETLGSVTTYSDLTVTNGTTYYYEVTAFSAVGEGPRSNERSATPARIADAPTLDSATAGDNTVTLAWSAPASTGGVPITAYRIFRGASSGSETLLATVGNVTAYTDTTAVNTTTYFYEVSAVNLAGESPRSNERSATAGAPPTAPAIDLVTRGDGAVGLDWSAPASSGGYAITEYRIYRGTSPGGETLLTSAPANVTSFADGGLTNGTTYFYEVSAVNARGEGPRSSEVSATPGLPSPPALVATPANGSVVLSWTPAADGGVPVTGYRMYRALQSGPEALVATLGNVTSYLDTTVANGAFYSYRVSAVNPVGESPESAGRTVVPTAVSIGAPNWWNRMCDAGHWNPAAALAGWSGEGAHALEASYLAVPVCGPRPGGDAAPTVPWARAGAAVPEWDASELVFRFLAQVYGVTPYAATAEDVVRSYTEGAGGGLEVVANGTAGKAPTPGDVASFDGPAAGHTAVVAWSAVDGSGNGSVLVLSQNDTATGWRTLAVTGWTLQGFGANTPYGWLHDPAGRGVADPPARNVSGRATEEPPDAEPRPEVPAPPPSTHRPPLPH
jgi:fibronectin type 3 domain-containing protein